MYSGIYLLMELSAVTDSTTSREGTWSQYCVACGHAQIYLSMHLSSLQSLRIFCLPARSQAHHPQSILAASISLCSCQISCCKDATFNFSPVAASRSPSAGTRTAFRRSSSATSSGVEPRLRLRPVLFRLPIEVAPQVAVWLSLYHCFSPSLYLSRCVRCLFSPVCVLSLSYLSISSAPRSERKKTLDVLTLRVVCECVLGVGRGSGVKGPC